MPEENTPTENNNNSGDGTGAGPTKTDKSAANAFDTSKIGDGDFDKIFEDPRLWKHPRFKSLNDRAKKADEFEAQQAKQKEEQLKEQGKFQELAEGYKGKYSQAQADNKIQLEASKLGAGDLEAVLKLIDRTNVVVQEDGTVTGVEEAVKSLLESKPYLKGNGSGAIGTGTNPGSDVTAGKKFKWSQLQDPNFYRANEEEILKAVKAGQVEYDGPQRQ